MSVSDNENAIEKEEHDYDLHLKKAAVYGWDGSQAVMVATTNDGSLKVNF